MAQEVPFDAVIIGGGPAGLSAALVLGRCRRKVAVCDGGKPRNAAARASHGFFTRDGEAPSELLRLGREQLSQYDVTFIAATAVAVGASREQFSITLSTGSRILSRKLLLATGLVDEVPSVPGIRPLYGKSVFHCPYCDGWEVRDEPLAVYGRGNKGIEYAIGLKMWSDDIVLCTDGRPLSTVQRNKADDLALAVRSEPIARLEGAHGILSRIVFASGTVLPRRALFFCLGTAQRSELPSKLGAEFNRKGEVKTDRFEATRVPGLYVAGDASRDANFIAIAVAEGVKAAVAIHKALRVAHR
jgi:thioredoxin reductase